MFRRQTTENTVSIIDTISGQEQINL